MFHEDLRGGQYLVLSFVNAVLQILPEFGLPRDLEQFGPKEVRRGCKAWSGDMERGSNDDSISILSS